MTSEASVRYEGRERVWGIVKSEGKGIKVVTVRIEETEEIKRTEISK